MQKRLLVLAIFAVGGIMVARGSSPAPSAGKVVRLASALSRIVPAGAKIEKVTTCCKWTEGPIWIHSGYLLFADIRNNRIMKWAPPDKTVVFMRPSGYLGKAPYGGPETGSNGMTLDARGRLTVAGHAQRDVWRLESLRPGAERTILAERYDGKRLNSPNDLVYRADGSLYFTDPPYGLPMQNDRDPHKELPFNGVYRIPNALTHPSGAPPDDAHLQLLIRDLPRPNGIAFSPDQKYLYVDNSQPQKLLMRYPVKPDGTLGPGIVFADLTSRRAQGSPDGMKIDKKGDIYMAGPGGVWIFAPSGKPLGRFLMPEVVANLAWGGADARTLYIAATTSVYRIHLEIPGIRP